MEQEGQEGVPQGHVPRGTVTSRPCVGRHLWRTQAAACSWESRLPSVWPWLGGFSTSSALETWILVAWRGHFMDKYPAVHGFWYGLQTPHMVGGLAFTISYLGVGLPGIYLQYSTGNTHPHRVHVRASCRNGPRFGMPHPPFHTIYQESRASKALVGARSSRKGAGRLVGAGSWM